MGEWTIKYGATQQNLPAWGFDDLIRIRQNLAPHVVTFIADGRAMDAAELFPYGSTVQVFDPDGDCWFYGRVEPWRREGRAGMEKNFGRLVNPWWHLMNCPFRHFWNQITGYDIHGNPILTQETTNHIFLNYSITGIQLTVAQQITEALNWAITRGAPIQIGEIAGLDIYIPSEEVKNITVAEVLNKMYRWIPDTNFDWDYTTSPYPTINCMRSSSMTPVNIDLNAGNLIEKVELTEREDWRRPYVLLTFEQDNNGVLATAVDFWPNPLPTDPAKQFGGFETVCTLNGLMSHTDSAYVQTTPIVGSDNASWMARIAWLSNPQITNLQLSNFTLAPQPGEVTTGVTPIYELEAKSPLPDWAGPAARYRATVLASFLFQGRPFTQTLTHDFKGTDVPTGPLVKTKISQPAEPVPIGLAKVIYDAFQALACEGSFTTVEQEVSGQINLLTVVNFLTPTQPGWATIAAIVQETEESAVEGRTAVHFGAPKHLTPNDIIDLLRVARQRNQIVSFTTRTGGETQRQINTSPGAHVAEKNSQAGPPMPLSGGGNVWL